MPKDTSMENEILDNNTNVYGIIYIISNTINEMKYVGQTVSHRKNKGKYRPFGALGRLKDHISEAINNTKKKQCSFLNNALRKYGSDAFSVKVLETCNISELDAKEQYYIENLNTLTPSGYNLTKGGKTFYKDTHLDKESLNLPKKRGGCIGHSDETRKKMSKRAKELIDDKYCMQRSSCAKDQHNTLKMERFKDCKINLSEIDSYIHKKGKAIIVTIDGIKASFAGKHETVDQLKERAKQFIIKLNNATLSNCGKPVKPE